MNRKWLIALTLFVGIIGGVIISKYYELVTMRAEEEMLRSHSQLQRELQETKDPLELFIKVAEVVKPSVVNIRTLKTLNVVYEDFPFLSFPQRQRQIGSGVIVDKEGYILTNYHVVVGADEIKVILADKREFRGKVIGRDGLSDLAVVKIKAKNLIPAMLGDSDKVKIGEWVVAIGNSFGLDHTVTSGIISARRKTSSQEDYDLIQTDAAINPGNSGGPLVNLKGEVIGINSLIFSRSGGYEGIGFALPFNRAKIIMQKLIKAGKVKRPLLGVELSEINESLANYYDLSSLSALLKELRMKEPMGAFITKVIRNSSADKAGLLEGDVIIRYNRHRINNPGDLVAQISKSKIGELVDLAIIRNGKEQSIKVKIGERD